MSFPKPFPAPSTFWLSRLFAIASTICVASLAYSQGHLRSIGTNSYGQLGIDGGFIESDTPFATDVAFATASGQHLFYTDTDGGTWAAGDNSNGQLGLGQFKRFIPEPTVLDQTFTHIYPNGSSTFFLKDSGDLYLAGKTPTGFVAPFSGAYISPIRVMHDIAKVAPYGSTNLYISKDGTLGITASNYRNRYGFPANFFPQLPLAEPIVIDSNVADALIASLNIVSLHEDGTLTTLGQNYNNPEHNPLEPLLVDENVIAISPWGTNNFSYLRSDGAAFLWLGHEKILSMTLSGAVSIDSIQFSKEDDTSWIVDIPAMIEAIGFLDFSTWEELILAPLEEVIKYSTGTGLNTSLRQNGDLYLSGTSQLLTGFSLGRYPDYPNDIDFSVVSVSVSEQTSLYLKEDGTLWGAGYNHNKQISNDPIDLNVEAPVQMMESVIAYDAAMDSSFAIDESGNLWGFGLVIQYANLNTDTEGPEVFDTGVTAVDSYNGSVSYIKSDGSLWLLGANNAIRGDFDEYLTYTSPHLVANDVTAIENTGTALFWIDTSKNLWTGASSLFESAAPRKIAEGVTFVEGTDSKAAAFYITESGELWSYGSSNFTDGDRNIPVLIESNVTKARSHLYDSLYYQKTDGTMWFRGFGSPYGSDSSEGPGTRESLQVFEGEEIQDFDTSRFHLLIVTNDSPIPTITQQPENQTINLGESATLTVEATGGFSGYTWYQGESGDRSNPLLQNGVPSYTVTPYATTTYWAEAQNTSGATASQTATITVTGGLSGNYLDWATWWGIPALKAAATANADSDLYPNYQEFALDLDPLRTDQSAYQLGFDPKRAEFYLSRPPNIKADGFLIFRFSDNLEQWTDIPPSQLQNIGNEDNKFWIQVPNNANPPNQFMNLEFIPPET